MILDRYPEVQLLLILWSPIPLLYFASLLPDPLFVFPPSDFGLEPFIIPNVYRELLQILPLYSVGVIVFTVLFYSEYRTEKQRKKRKQIRNDE